jgi:hypothetical protein
MHQGKEKRIGNVNQMLKGRHDLGNLSVDGRIILKYFSKKHNVRLWVGSMLLSIGTSCVSLLALGLRERPGIMMTS